MVVGLTVGGGRSHYGEDICSRLLLCFLRSELWYEEYDSGGGGEGGVVVELAYGYGCT